MITLEQILGVTRRMQKWTSLIVNKPSERIVGDQLSRLFLNLAKGEVGVEFPCKAGSMANLPQESMARDMTRGGGRESRRSMVLMYQQSRKCKGSRNWKRGYSLVYIRI